jgi:selenocysteine lyase/cysteine desulfurase
LIDQTITNTIVNLLHKYMIILILGECGTVDAKSGRYLNVKMMSLVGTMTTSTITIMAAIQSNRNDRNIVNLSLIILFFRFYKAKKNHVVTTQTEHKCVLDSCRQLEAEGFEVTYLPVQKNGLVDLAQLEESLKSTTSLVSIMTVKFIAIFLN